MNSLQVLEKCQIADKDFIVYGTADNPLFLAKDVAEWIEHSKASVMLDAVDETEKLRKIIFTSGQRRECWFLTEDGLYEVLMQSRKPIAKQFKKQVKKILKDIRQTGTYTANPTDLQRQRLAIMDRNSKSREASLWLKIAAGSSVPAYKDVANAYAANILAGREVLPLPEVSEQTYSATDIGRMLGVSALKIGQLANKHGLKTAENGKLFYDKSRYSNKQVETFRYYSCAVDKFRVLLGGVTA